MRRLLLSAVLILLAAIAAEPAQAQLTFCNHTSDAAYVTVKLHSGGSVWRARGWFRLLPRECAPVSEGKLLARTAYYVANTAAGLFWEDDEATAGEWCLRTDRAIDQDNQRCRTEPARSWRWNTLETGGAGAFKVALTETRTSPTAALTTCADSLADANNGFLHCWVHAVSSEKQRRMLDCMLASTNRFARMVCAANPGAASAIVQAAECLTSACTVAIDAEDRARVASCLAGNGGPGWAAAVCAGAGWITAEQRRFADCAMAASSEPLALTQCVAGPDAAQALQRCFDDSLEDADCLGKTAAIIASAWRDIATSGTTDDLVGDASTVRHIQTTAITTLPALATGANVAGCSGWLARSFGTRCDAPRKDPVASNPGGG